MRMDANGCGFGTGKRRVSTTEKAWSYFGAVEFDEKINIASGLVTSQQSIDVALEVSGTFKFSATLVLMLGTLQSEGVRGIDGEHMTSVVCGSSTHPSIVPVDSTICLSESSSQFVMHQSYLHDGHRQFVQE